MKYGRFEGFMDFFKSKKEILVTSDNFSASYFQRSDRFNLWFSNCTLHLYDFLTIQINRIH